MTLRPTRLAPAFASAALLAIFALLPALSLSPPAAHGQPSAGLILQGRQTASSPGALVTYTLSISNTGTASTGVALKQTGGDWDLRLPESLDIAAGEAAEIVVGLEVPATAADGHIEIVELQAEGEGASADLRLAAWLGGRISLGRTVGCRFDLDQNGAITLDDVDLVEALAGAQIGSPEFNANYDFDHNGKIDPDDIERVVDRLKPACDDLVAADSTALQEAVTVEAVRKHLQAYQAIGDANGKTRAARTPGHESSVDYVAGELGAAGYEPIIQPFVIPTYRINKPASISRLSPDPMEVAADQVSTFSASGSGAVTATLQAVDLQLPPSDAPNGSTSGCEAEDFAGFVAGNVALIQRGSCNFSAKVNNAETAGAAAVIIFNEGQAGRQDVVTSSAGRLRSFPVVGTSFAVGQDLANSLAAGEPVTVAVAAWGEMIDVETWNVLAELKGRRQDRAVVVGGHLDSVPAGPGINDNGSGTAAILELAIQMAALGIEPENTVRFAFWSGEELGLLGSRFYVGNLTPAEQADVMANLNFDMIGSPNFFRGIYDGDGSLGGDAPDGPAGSGEIEAVFRRFFDGRGLPHDPTAFDGRSDYGPFIANGIPAGGLFTGAEEEKSERMAERYGGTAGVAYDACYHRDCDTIDNINWEVLDEMVDAVTDATYALAMDRYLPLINGRLGGMGLDAPALPQPADPRLFLPWLQRP
jgi:Zn-dependent M28 family amino/carboxypeptidase